jgi:(E)-4-hydroxy-3-methylbut-2-enyl-diphosphate synthase
VHYCASRFHTVRRRSTEVRVGSVAVGGDQPIRVQSMTTSDTQDIDATVRQCIALAEVGCEIVRVTAPNVAAARCLREIRARLSAAGFAHVPLVADIHFLPAAAMEAVEHVEKVRVNPGNYADKKKFAVREYSDSEYAAELERLHAAFSPLVRRCRELGRSLRIGTNHGSLSDRILNRFGDTPLGMVESALEFVRIAEDHGFHDLILSMKSSNPKVMIQAYRLLVARMDAAHRPYPLHLGVTEAGDGEDGRIKSAIGIGSLLLDGLGDTIRVSLTEDSVYEIPVAQALARKAMAWWSAAEPAAPPLGDSLDPYHYRRRPTDGVTLSTRCRAGGSEVPAVVVPWSPASRSAEDFNAWHRSARAELPDTPPEGLLINVAGSADLAAAAAIAREASQAGLFLVLEVAPDLALDTVRTALSDPWPAGTVWARHFHGQEPAALAAWLEKVTEHGGFLAADIRPAELHRFADVLARPEAAGRIIFTAAAPVAGTHPVGTYRQLVECLAALGVRAPVWIRNRAAHALNDDTSFLGRLLDASVLTGSLLADGIGDLVSIETETDPVRAVRLAYNVLQGAGARISKTEFVACPSCGRTLFDLQSTTQRIRAQTGHLKGVKIAIMGCIVNGPGEMADADFGYVGGAPGKINLYVGKTCVRYNIPAAEADARLIDLIKQHGRWVDPAPAAPATPAAAG